MLAISLPWYVIAELKTPGFLKYFLVGEHFLRFVDAGWAGDRYGTAHARAWGAIWLDWIAASAPWSLLLVTGLLVLPLKSSLRQAAQAARSEEHTSELQSLMRISYAVFCLKKKSK